MVSIKMRIPLAALIAVMAGAAHFGGGAGGDTWNVQRLLLRAKVDQSVVARGATRKNQDLEAALARE
jgi:hypothetical protein